MYIKKVEIKNIRSISEFTMEFPEGREAGWHVLIGDNGAGKSTILKAIVMGLLGGVDVLRLNPDWESWVKKGTDSAQINLSYIREDKDELPESIRKKNEAQIELHFDASQAASKLIPVKVSWRESDQPSHKGKRFSCAFGPFRRFTGGESIDEKEKTTPITPYITLFRAELALSSTLTWIKDQHLRSLEKNSAAEKVIQGLKMVIASGNLLPNRLIVDKITADGIFFKDAENTTLHINDLSDGVKSMLSLALELIRLMLDKYSAEEIFGDFAGSGEVPVAGVVLIDEIDAHLHPSWQTRIGQWFTRYFPKIQFIVTTHSPLICRGCLNTEAELNGSIWRLAAPGSKDKSGQLDTLESNRLIFGNILDAFGTGAFGEDVERTATAQDMLKELARLDKLFTFGKITPEQNLKRQELQKIFSTDVITDF